MSFQKAVWWDQCIPEARKAEAEAIKKAREAAKAGGGAQ
jgi:hypothetical protein